MSSKDKKEKQSYHNDYSRVRAINKNYLGDHIVIAF